MNMTYIPHIIQSLFFFFGICFATFHIFKHSSHHEYLAHSCQTAEFQYIHSDCKTHLFFGYRYALSPPRSTFLCTLSMSMVLCYKFPVEEGNSTSWSHILNKSGTSSVLSSRVVDRPSDVFGILFDNRKH